MQTDPLRLSFAMKRDRAAFTVLELIVVMMLVGVMAAIAVPRFNFALITKHRASTTARKLVVDLRRARRLAISDAANNNQGFELQMQAPSPYTSYEIIDRDPPIATVDSHTIDSQVSCTGDARFRFGPLGNLTDAGSTEIIVAGGGRSYTITVTVATGAVRCVEN